MVDSVTADLQKEQLNAPKRKISVKNVSPKGQRFFFDATGKQIMVGPGETAEAEVTEATATQMEAQSKAGSDIQIEGHEPEEAPANEAAPEIPEEQETRVKLAEAEAKIMEEGQEADKERRERDAKKTGAQLAAETGIHMHARGVKPEVVAAPPDAPPKSSKK